MSHRTYNLRRRCLNMSSSACVMKTALSMMMVTTLVSAHMYLTEENIGICITEGGADKTLTDAEKKMVVEIFKKGNEEMRAAEENMEAQNDDYEMKMYEKVDQETSIGNKDEGKKFARDFAWCMAAKTVKKDLEDCQEASNANNNQFEPEKIAKMGYAIMKIVRKEKDKVNKDMLLEGIKEVLDGDEEKAKQAMAVFEALHKCHMEKKD